MLLDFLISTIMKLLLESLRHGVTLFLSEVLAELHLASVRAQGKQAVSGHSAFLEHYLRPVAIELVPAHSSSIPPLHQHSIPFDREALEICRMPLHVAKRNTEHAELYAREREHKPGAEKSKSQGDRQRDEYE